MKRVTVLIFALASIVVSTLSSRAATAEEQLLARAKTLLDHGRWSDARHEYMRLREIVAVDDESMVQQAEFGLTVCAVHLDDNIAEQRMLDFLSRYPGSVHSADVNFLLALHYCEQERFAEAKAALQKVPYKSLTKANREKYDMRMGYAEFVLGNHDAAYQYFTRIPSKSDYSDHATYYCAYIHYSRGQYDEAYKGFASLRESEAYGKVIPYYIFQLEFARGNYKYAARESEALISGAAESERPALMRIAAESWYRLEGYNKSLYYMKAYVAAGGKMERVENYILGYSAYRTTDYATAVDALKKVSTGNDELSQNASYHLADCYLRRGDKRNAIRAFAMAADDIYTNEVAEDALFNYGKLLFEMGGGTFNEAVNVLTRYVTRYPTSPRNTEARELLIAAYYNSKDYDAAYRAIRSFPSPDGNMKTALQKITYFKALEAF
ncbi:MAG: tetratricopeptide repeat protein, partial [Alistipes sp.]|nr:tetratricopeptide repeat protein [Alistipes sp.]